MHFHSTCVVCLILTVLAGCDVTGTTADSSGAPRGQSRLDEPAGDGGKDTAVTEYDAAALHRIGQNSLGVVVLSRLAAEKATNAGLKGFAGRVQRAHNDLNVRMEHLAKTRGIALAKQLSDADNRELARLKKLAGKEFDLAYADAMVQNFSLIANTMYEEAKRGSDGAVREFCANNEAAVRERNQAAKQFRTDLAK